MDSPEHPAANRTGHWMDNIDEFALLAEAKLSKIIADDLKAFALGLLPELDGSIVARQIRSFISYADKPVLVREKVREHERDVTRTFWHLLIHPEFRIVNEDKLEDGYLQLLLFPDFQLLYPLIRHWRDQASEMNIDWGRVKKFIELALQTLTRETAAHTAIAVTGVAKRVRQPFVTARHTAIRNILSKRPAATSRDICGVFDDEEIPTPPTWQEAGLKTWVAAYTNASCRPKLHKLISADKAYIQRSHKD
jgi:hypothetical protein